MEEPNYSKEWIEEWTPLWGKHTDDDLKNKVPKNPLGICSTYCDKSIWSRHDGVQNFWNAINEGCIDMTYEFFQTL